jgi:pimeloyl-ACP methyl ester carboxylesterase
MTGSKASAVEELAERRGHASVRFDYFGHGASSGAFRDGRIGRWREDALAVVDELSDGPQVLVGSSMGAWIALLVALSRPERVAALVGVAPAPDFTEELIWERCDEEERETLRREGVLWRRSPDQGEAWPLTLGLIEEARQHRVMQDALPLRFPVRLIHGLADLEVPWSLSRRLAERLESPDVELTLVKGGDHRLSSPADLGRLAAVLERLLRRVS